jgi:predicted lipid-binding transport protein (Tim44 family)
MSIGALSLGRMAARLIVLLAGVVVGMAMVVPDADAGRRLGGGKSFGRQSDNVMQRQAPPSARRNEAAPAAPAGQPQSAGPRWGGMLGGLAARLGIAALLSHLGLSGAFAQMLGSLLMIGLLVFAAMFLWRMLRGAQARPLLEPAPVRGAAQPATSQPSFLRSREAQPGSIADTIGRAGADTAAPTQTPRASWTIPADFDAAGFLRSAKVHFLRLQTAWNANNLDDLREFTTPEVFAELRMQLTEDGDTGRADIADLEAELLGIESISRDYLASVRFTGTTRDGTTEEPFVEVWNLSKPLRGKGGWLLAGIQQV